MVVVGVGVGVGVGLAKLAMILAIISSLLVGLQEPLEKSTIVSHYFFTFSGVRSLDENISPSLLYHLSFAMKPAPTSIRDPLSGQFS